MYFLLLFQRQYRWEIFSGCYLIDQALFCIRPTGILSGGTEPHQLNSTCSDEDLPQGVEESQFKDHTASQTDQADDSRISSREFARPPPKSSVPGRVLVRADCKLLDFLSTQLHIVVYC